MNHRHQGNHQDSLRCFVALEIPSDVRDALDQLTNELRGRVPGGVVKWVRPENMHLTVKFLGAVDVGQVDGICSALGGAASNMDELTLTVEGLGCFPNVHRPSVVWAGVHSAEEGSLLRVVDAVEQVLRPLGFPSEQRPFSPHLTLGRLSRDARPADARRMGQVLASTVVGSLGAVQVKEMVLMKSDLQPKGPVYSRLGAFPLRGKP